jgi:tetratricopeptide (TPR) repeat protein
MPEAPLVSSSPEPESGQLAAAPKDLDLTQFRPLLAEPELAAVRNHVDRDEFARAASALETHVQKSSAEGPREARLQYLRGVLLLGAENTSDALDAFTRASKTSWILREDALLQVAELQLAHGQAAPALSTLDQIVDLGNSPRARSVRGTALAQLKKYEAAAALLRPLADETEDASIRLELAAVLLDQAEALPEGAERLQVAKQGAFQAQLAALGHGPDDDLSKHAEALLNRASASGAQARDELSLELQLRHLRGLVDARQFEEAEEVSLAIKLPAALKFSKERCEYDHLAGKVLSGLRRWGEAADRIS